jgi:hypothetical protein
MRRRTLLQVEALESRLVPTTVMVGPSKDNTLYDIAGDFSDGAGPNFFVGDDGFNGGGTPRRGVIAFDVAGNVPAGATINNVTLKLNMSKSNAGPTNIDLHALQADWGEGTSNAGINGGGGAPATTNDATWIYRFFNATTPGPKWTNPGGDFSSTVSATTSVGGIGSYTWGSTTQMVADVQGWLNNPSTNFGWILIGNESQPTTAKRFDTKENSTAGNRPTLTIDYSVAAGPPAVVFAAFVPSTKTFAVVEMFHPRPSSPTAAGAKLTISGNTGPGGAASSMITISAGPATAVNGANGLTITTVSAAELTAINVNLLNDNVTLTVGTATGIVNLPGATLNVTLGSGNDTINVGTTGSPAAAAVNNVLGAVNVRAANPNGTGTESVSIVNATVGSASVQESSGAGDSINLWGVTASGSVTLTQNNGAGDTISVDQLNATNPGNPPTVTLVPSSIGTLQTAQGDGSNDNTTVNRTTIGVSLTATQGNGASDALLLGPGDTVGTAVASVFNGPVQLTQGTGNGDYLGLANLQAGATTLVQQDVAANQTGDTVGGVTASAIPPGGNGLDSSSPTANANLVTANNNATLLRTVPTNGLAGAVLQQLNITQGSAGSDLVALVQLPAGTTTNTSLTVAGGTGVPGTITILQQDVAGGRSDFIFLGSYIPGTGSFTTQTPPFPYTPGTVGARGSITALNEIITQGNAAGDVLSVLFDSTTGTTAQQASLFTQGNGGDRAIFQEDSTASGGQFNYKGGSGGNRVQADSDSVTGTFDGGAANVANNHLTQDNQNPFITFMDFGDTVFG